MCVRAKSLQLCLTLRDLWTVARQAPLSMGFSRQEYWSGLLCPPPGDLPDPGTEPTSLTSPALAGRYFTTSVTWEALKKVCENTYLGPPRKKLCIRSEFSGEKVEEEACSLWDVSLILYDLSGKAQFSFQSQRKAMPKNVQSTTKLHPSYTLVK